MEIMKNLSREDYDNMDCLNASRMSLLLKSPRHFQLNIHKETDAMKLGTAIHMAYLEPARFKESYVSEPLQVLCDARDESGKKLKMAEKTWQPLNKRMKDHKEWLEEWRKAAESKGSVVLTDDEMGGVAGVLNSITEEMRFPPPKEVISVQELLATKDCEVSVVGEIFGRKVKARADLITETRLGRTVVDIKKTSKIAPHEFTQAVYSRNYDLQAAWYKEVFKADAFIWLCCESDAPYAIATYNAENFIDIGKEKIKKAFETLDRCEKENYFPWYSRGVESLHPTSWQLKLHFDENGGEIHE